MAISLYTFVDLYRRQIDAVRHLLAKGADHAKANGISEQEMLGWRLAEDMHPLAFQVRVVVNFPRTWTARAAGLEPPEARDPATLAECHAGLDEAQAWLAALTPDQFEEREDVPLTVEIMPGLEPTLSAAHWLTVFATTNIYFHVSMVYAILRAKGVLLGKADMFPSGL